MKTKNVFNSVRGWVKKINSPFKHVGREFSYNINSVFATFLFWRMKRRALRACKMTGLQHHIVPSSADKCAIINNRLKKVPHLWVLKNAYFSTPVGSRVLTK